MTREFRLPRRTAAQIRREVDDEIDFHIDMRVRELIDAGVPRDEARARAAREFGDVETTRAYCRAQDEALAREHRRIEWLAEARQDVRHAGRLLRHSPGFAAVVLLTLALGIGANTAIFSVINGVLLNALPYRDAGRVVRIWEWKSDYPHGQVSAADFVDWRAGQHSFAGLAAFTYGGGATYAADEGAEFIPGIQVSANYFQVLGVSPYLGRTFREDEDRPGSLAMVVVVSYGLWQRLFGGDPAAVGRHIKLSGRTYTIVGVLPRNFRAPEMEAELFMPVDMGPLLRDPERARKLHWLGVLGRLKASATPESALADLMAIAHRLEHEYPDRNTGHLVALLPIRAALTGDVRPTLLLLLGAAGFVLLIACANVANVVLSRAVSRQRELAIRAALGAGRGRLARQMVTESVLLALAGGGLGLVAARWGTGALLAVNPDLLPRTAHVTVDVRVLAFTAVIAVLTGVLFGLAPVLSGSAHDLQDALRDGTRGSQGRLRLRLRGLLVTVQVALAAMLLIGAGLLIRSVDRLQSQELGFDPSRLLTFRLSLPSARYDSSEKIISFYEALTGRLNAMPGVTMAATGSALPFIGGAGASLVIEGRPLPVGPPPEVRYFAVSRDYWKTLHIPLLRGRSFGASDRRSTPGVIVINQAAAERFWPGQDPVGAHIKLGPDPSEPWSTVIGVVGDVRQRDLATGPQPSAFVFNRQDVWSYEVVAVRTAGDPHRLLGPVRRTVKQLDPGLALIDPQTMDERIAGSVARWRFTMLLLGMFAGVALALAAVGVYAVLAYAVSARTPEIGIRMALGARRANVLALVARQGLGAAMLGLALGLAAAMVASRLLSSFLYEVQPLDAPTFTVVALLLAAVAVAACVVPARRATRADPIIAMRAE